MADERLVEALRAMQPSVSAGATEDALHSVHAASSARRRRQRRLVAAVGAAAAVVLVAGAVAVMIDDDPGETVVVDQPTTASPSATTTTASTTSTSAAPASTQVGTLDDLALGVTGLELRTWWTDGEDPQFWNGFWRADSGVAEQVAAAIVGSAGAVRPDETDVVTMRFELADGRFVFVDVDIESGWVEPDRQLPADLARVLRTGFNDAVGRPWEEDDLSHPGSPVAAALDRVSFPIADLAEVAGNFQEAFEASLDADYERWFVEVIDDGYGPFVEVRHRGEGDDSSNGTDYRISLVETSGGWRVGDVTRRHLCSRSTPGPPPMFGCL